MKLQQKGLEDYKLATANASMNADFSMEEGHNDIRHGIAAINLEAGDASAPKQNVSPVDNSEKLLLATAAKEVWILSLVHLLVLCFCDERGLCLIVFG